MRASRWYFSTDVWSLSLVIIWGYDCEHGFRSFIAITMCFAYSMLFNV